MVRDNDKIPAGIAKNVVNNQITDRLTYSVTRQLGERYWFRNPEWARQHQRNTTPC
jgi:hypothetical protein